jgi:hypothetical protein
MKSLAGFMMSAMKLLNSPLKIFFLGLACVLLGFVLPFLIVLGIIENTFVLSFFIYVLQLIGMILGVIAAAGLAINKRFKDEELEAKEREKDEQESTIGWMK